MNDDDGGIQYAQEMRYYELDWLADRAAQAEYQSWLDLLNMTRHEKEPTCHAQAK